MTRWHAPSCKRPSVELSDDKWPFCMACGETCPPLEELIALDQAAGDTSVLTLPPDEPQGMMNLYWPSCVRYVLPESGSMQESCEVQQNKEHFQRTIASMEKSTPIHDTTLDNSQFRVAYIPPSPSDEYPVHVTLETYSHDCHPEYEAVSYLWGGEDGDNSRCRPIFIGNYWDVLLQTRNCWSMLRFLRPRRGERLLWVDALCINQQNLKERAVQVAMMGRIYENGARVVVYLGDDIVTQTTSFSRYRTLDTLAVSTKNEEIFPRHHAMWATPFDFSELLTRRYFSRIWVIQELVLCERVVFRIGDVDFRADAKTMAQLIHKDACNRVDWASTAAPWVQCMAQKSFTNLPATEVYALLKFTQKSSCSDPRDKLFGVIGLLQDANARKQYRPAYDLSYLHFCIGLFGSWITNHAAFHLLQQAGTITRASPGRPTWLPVYDEPGFWRTFFSPTDITYAYRSPREAQKDEDRTTTCYSLLADIMMKIGRLGGESFPIYLPDSALCSSESVVSPGRTQINTLTGGLVVPAVHLHDFKSKPFFLGTLKNSDHLFLIKGSPAVQTQHDLYITSRVRLDDIICPGKDCLFMLHGGIFGFSASYGTVIWQDHIAGNSRIVFLVLRHDSNDMGRVKQYRLVTANLHLLSAGAPLRHIESDESNFRPFTDLKAKPVDRAIEYIKSMTNRLLDPFLGARHSDIDEPSHKLISDKLIHNLDKLNFHASKLYINCVWQQIFPSITQRGQLCEVLIALCQAQSSSDPTLEMQRVVIQANWDVRARAAANKLTFTFGRHLSKHRIYYVSLIILDMLIAMRRDWGDVLGFLHVRLLRDLKRSPALSRRNPYDFLKLCDALDWECKFPIHDGWLTMRNTLNLDSVDDGYETRVPFRQVLDFLQEEVDAFLPHLYTIMEAHDPPLTMRQAMSLALDGTIEEQRGTGAFAYTSELDMGQTTVDIEIL